MAVEGKLPAVPETILKRRKRQAENRALRAKEAVKSKVCVKLSEVVSFLTFYVLRLHARPSAPRSSSGPRSSPRSTRIRRGMRSGVATEPIKFGTINIRCIRNW